MAGLNLAGVRARLYLVGDVALVLMAGDEAAVNTFLQVLLTCRLNLSAQVKVQYTCTVQC